MFNVEGHAHELTFSCYQRSPFLSKDRTRVFFTNAMDAARQRCQFDIWAYVIMPEHLHLLIRPRNRTYRMSEILKAIKQPVARRAMAFLRENKPEALQRFEIRRPSGKVEYRFWQQGGGYDRNIVSPAIVRASVEYIHANPVRRGLVTRTTDWYWSSARWYAGHRSCPLEIDPIEL